MSGEESREMDKMGEGEREIPLQLRNEFITGVKGTV